MALLHATSVAVAFLHAGSLLSVQKRHGNGRGCQFHPEKSLGTGLAILRNYVSIVRASAARGKDVCA